MLHNNLNWMMDGWMDGWMDVLFIDAQPWKGYTASNERL